MAHLTQSQAKSAIINLTDQELMDLMDSVEMTYDYVNEVLIDRERIISRLIGECLDCQGEVTITYTSRGKKTETKKSAKPTCQTCGG